MYIKRNKYINRLYKFLFKSKLEMDNNRKSASVKEKGYIIVKEINKIFEEAECLYFVDFGTLLGVIRDKKLIEWDCDIDFGVVLNEKFTWCDLELLMNSNGYKKVRQFKFKDNITEQTYEKDDLTIDFFNHFENGDRMTVYSYYRKEGFIYNNQYEMHVLSLDTVKISGTKKVFIDNNIFVVPNEAEEYLENAYTESWKIPNPNWVSGSSSFCKWLDDSQLAYLDNECFK